MPVCYVFQNLLAVLVETEGEGLEYLLLTIWVNVFPVPEGGALCLRGCPARLLEKELPVSLTPVFGSRLFCSLHLLGSFL